MSKKSYPIFIVYSLCIKRLFKHMVDQLVKEFKIQNFVVILFFLQEHILTTIFCFYMNPDPCLNC